MAPKATLRVLAETLAAKGWDCNRISEEIGMHPEYARKVVNTVNRNEGCDPYRATAEDHKRHLQALYDANGYGFSWWPTALMERVYLLETSPHAARQFWNAR